MTEILFLTVHKAASRFFSKRFLPKLARNTRLEYLNPEDEAWKADIPAIQNAVDKYADRHDCLLGPIRVPKTIRNPTLFDDWRKVLLLRDPRDVLTSYYFSMAFSHTLPKGEVLAARFEEARAKTMAEPIDDFVLRLLPMVRSRFDDYRRRIAPRPNLLLLKYEDMITDWDRFSREFMSFTGVTAGPAWAQRLQEFSAEFSVAAETPTAHKRQVKAGDHLRKLAPETLAVLDRELAPILEWLELEPSPAPAARAKPPSAGLGPEVTDKGARPPRPEVEAATLAGAFERLRLRPVQIGGMISLGAGRGRDMKFFSQLWPDAATLLIDMDRQFEPGYREIQARDPRVRYEICGAAGEDRIGHRIKSNDFGGAVITGSFAGDAADLIETPFKRLDTLVAEHRIPGPYFLKFDTHGAEVDILAGAKEVLADTALILMECYNFKFTFMEGRNLTFDEMSLHMKTLGFRVIDLCDAQFRPADGALWQLHLIFAREDNPAFRSNSFRDKRKSV